MAKEYSAKGSSEVFDKDVEGELNLSFISFACNLLTGTMVAEATLVIDTSMEYLENL